MKNDTVYLNEKSSNLLLGLKTYSISISKELNNLT